MKSSGGFFLWVFFFLPSDSDLTLILSEFVIFNFLRCVQLLFEGCLLCLIASFTLLFECTDSFWKPI